ncbi:MAG TPA: AI-2E family transporter [Stellaceae bacterium]|nr:AI-2E family transporter [Stellaceae bacterium]
MNRNVVFWLAGLLVLLLAIYELSGILLPFAAGGAIAYFLDPVVDRLERWLPRTVATVLVLLSFLLMLAIVVMLVLPIVELQAAEISKRLPNAIDLGRRQINAIIQLARDRLAPEDVARMKASTDSWVGTVIGWLVGVLQGIFTSGLAFANIVLLLFVTPVVAFFLLRDWDRLVARIDSWLPRHYVDVIREQARLVDATLAGFVHGQALVSLGLGVYYAVALTLVRLDFGITLGLLIGILSFIPFVGFVTGLILALSLSALQFGSWTGVGLVAGVFIIGQIVENNILAPKLIGSRVHLHPVWVIFALLAFGSVFGFLGVLLALPSAAVIGVLARFGINRYLASPLYDRTNSSAES